VVHCCPKTVGFKDRDEPEMKRKGSAKVIDEVPLSTMPTAMRAASAFRRYRTPRIVDRSYRPQGAIAKLQEILSEKGITGEKAEQAIRKTMIEADRRRPVRQPALSEQRAQSQADTKTLIDLLRVCCERLSGFSPRAIAELNAVVAKCDLRSFDTEVFDSLIAELVDVLPRLRPGPVARTFLATLLEPVNTMTSAQRSRPKIIDLWDALPAATRSSVEQAIRCDAPLRSIGKLLQRIEVLLTRFAPKHVRRTVPIRLFAIRVGDIVRKLGLRPTLNYLVETAGHPAKAVDGWFQDYCHAALRAVGSSERVSRRQVRHAANCRRAPNGIARPGHA
jgi:hypothetical protein